LEVFLEVFALSHLKNLTFPLISFFSSSFEIEEIALIICLHPGSDYQLYKSYLKGLNIKKQNSLYYISKSSLCIFHESSLILDAFNLNKKILILKSETLGDYYKLRINEYIKVFKLSYLNLDLKENNLTKKLNILKVKSSKKKNKSYKTNKKIFFLINKLF